MIENNQPLRVRALDAATNPVLITEPTGCIVWINNAFCLLSGYSKPELVSKTPPLHFMTGLSAARCRPTSPASAPAVRESHKRQTAARH